MPRCELTDDGTMDTVIRCSDCGAEQRYNYDASMRDDVSCDAHDTYDADCSDCQTAEDVSAEQDYTDFVDGCIEDMESEHTCDSSEDTE